MLQPNVDLRRRSAINTLRIFFYSEASVEIPSLFESVEALNFLGFTREAAKGIFKFLSSQDRKRTRETHGAGPIARLAESVHCKWSKS